MQIWNFMCILHDFFYFGERCYIQVIYLQQQYSYAVFFILFSIKLHTVLFFTADHFQCDHLIKVMSSGLLPGVTPIYTLGCTSHSAQILKTHLGTASHVHPFAPCLGLHTLSRLLHVSHPHSV